MTRSAWLRENDRHWTPRIRHFTYPSGVKFFLRYPIFLLGFGPPIVRSGAIDATSGVIDFWSILQVGWLVLISFRAINRLVSAQSILIPKQIRSILRLAFFLGLLFLASAAYSHSPLVSAAYSVFYFLTLICVTEFVVDVYRNPPNWIECLFHLRFIALLLSALVVLTLPIHPSIVMMTAPGLGARLVGGSVAPMTLVCPVIAIISAYTFLHSLEPRGRACFIFFVGLTGTLATQARASEIALLIVLSLIAIDWSRTSRRAGSFVIFGLIAFVISSGALVGAFGGVRMWSAVNRGQSAEGIASASGRTEIWKFVVQYCMSHPQGMGYVTGFRILFRQSLISESILDVIRIGNTHNMFAQFLADAGWVALTIYLVMLVKVFALGFRFAAKRSSISFVTDNISRHVLSCALALLIYFFVEGFGVSDYAIPLRASFYFQNLVIAIILGVSARLIAASRRGRAARYAR